MAAIGLFPVSSARVIYSNRRGFLTLAEHQLKVADRSNSTLALLFMDLDNFKSINDTLGHAEGDKVLVSAAEILRNTFRQSDILGRFGGDEFVVLITDENDTTEDFLKARLETSLNEFNSEQASSYKHFYQCRHSPQRA